jgi:Nif-specific regulatory protein
MATFSGSTAACANPAAITAGSPQRRKGLVAFSSPRVLGTDGSPAARILGMTPRQIAYRIQTLNIEVKQF